MRFLNQPNTFKPLPGTALLPTNSADEPKNSVWVGTYMKVPHYSQPNTYTCGATVTAMAKAWKQISSYQTVTSPDILTVYKTLNTDGQSGVSADEIKAGFRKIVQWNTHEKSYSDVKSAISETKWNLHNAPYYPVVLYGNTYYGSAGGHYYLVTGAITCSNCSVQIYGWYMHDSVYQSPAYPQTPEPKLSDYGFGPLAIAQWTNAWYRWYKSTLTSYIKAGSFLTHEEIGKFWKPTGSSLPWNKKHMLVGFELAKYPSSYQ